MGVEEEGDVAADGGGGVEEGEARERGAVAEAEQAGVGDYGGGGVAAAAAQAAAGGDALGQFDACRGWGAAVGRAAGELAPGDGDGVVRAAGQVAAEVETAGFERRDAELIEEVDCAEPRPQRVVAALGGERRANAG